jgi:hypothetical protein
MWATRGVHGAVLETVEKCGKRYTSRDAVQRFEEAMGLSG